MRTFMAALLAVSVFGCDDEPNPLPQDLTVILDMTGSAATLTATLTGAQEVPAVATTYTGESTVSVDATHTTITVATTHTIPPANTTIAHIHVGAVGVSGPVIFNLVTTGPVPSSFNNTLTNANLTPQSAAGVNSFEDAVNKILAGETYVNIHSMTYPNGEIRGQLHL
jgi:hypothetical protein